VPPWLAADGVARNDGPVWGSRHRGR